MQLCIVVTGNRQETIKGDGLGKVIGEESLAYRVGKRGFGSPDRSSGIRKRNCSGKERDGKIMRIWEAGR